MLLKSAKPHKTSHAPGFTNGPKLRSNSQTPYNNKNVIRNFAGPSFLLSMLRDFGMFNTKFLHQI